MFVIINKHIIEALIVLNAELITDRPLAVNWNGTNVV